MDNLLFYLLPVSKLVNSSLGIHLTPKITTYSWSSSILGSFSYVNRKSRKIGQNRDFSWTIVQGNLRFWSKFRFRLKHSKPTPNFMGITNMWSDLMSAQRLRSYCVLPVYFRKICIQVACELCSLHISQNFKLGLINLKCVVPILYVS